MFMDLGICPSLNSCCSLVSTTTIFVFLSIIFLSSSAVMSLNACAKAEEKQNKNISDSKSKLSLLCILHLVYFLLVKSFLCLKQPLWDIYPKMLICTFCGKPASRSPFKKTFLKKIRRIDILYRLFILSQGRRKSIHANRPAVEFLYYCREKFSVYIVKPLFINVKCKKRFLCYLQVRSEERRVGKECRS